MKFDAFMKEAENIDVRTREQIMNLGFDEVLNEEK